ncbi:MAG: hydrogenase iron-sulfur subunit [Candidatus Latescibacterota bacterium]
MMSDLAVRPNIVVYCCAHSGYEAADRAGRRHLSYPVGVRIVRVPCSGKVDAIYLLKAFEQGADGVLVVGCHEDSCQFLTGNLRAKKRVDYVRGLLQEIGLEPERVRMAHVASVQDLRFVELVREMEETLTALGPIVRKEQ